MPPQIATVVCILGIAGLFTLDRDRSVRTSMGLWIPVVWMWIVGSREVSKWLAAFGMGPAWTLSASPELAGSPVDRNVYAVLLMLGVTVLLRRGPQVGRLLRANGPILLFFLYCAVSVLWSDYPEVSFKRWIKDVGDLVMVLVVVTDPGGLTAIKRLLARTSFLLIPFSVLLIRYYPVLGQGWDVQTGKQGFIGVTADKNGLGVTCLIFGLGCLWRFLTAYRERERTHRSRHLIVHGVLLAMVVWLFLMANSITSLGCFVLAGSLMVATSFPALVRRRAVVHLLVAMVLVVTALLLFLDVGTGVLEAVGRDPTLTGRTEIWREVIRMTENPLFGTGFESFWLGPRLDKIWSAHWWHPNEAHNGYIEVFLNLGLMGVILLAIVIVNGYRNVVGLLRRDPEASKIKLAYFVVGVVYSFTEAGFRLLNPVWIFFLLAAMAVPKRPVRKRTGAKDSLAEIAVKNVAPEQAMADKPGEIAAHESLSSLLCQ